MAFPLAHREEAQKLTAEGIVDLFEISLRNVDAPIYLRFRDGPPGGQTAYGGKIWEHAPLKVSGWSRSAEEERSRPRITVVNPLGLWNRHAIEGRLDRAILSRFRVLRSHLEGSVNIYEQQIWYVARVTDVITNQGITMELRSLSDGPDQLLPVRKYMPDAGFPFVTLK